MVKVKVGVRVKVRVRVKASLGFNGMCWITEVSVVFRVWLKHAVASLAYQ